MCGGVGACVNMCVKVYTCVLAWSGLLCAFCLLMIDVVFCSECTRDKIVRRALCRCFSCAVCSHILIDVHVYSLQ